MRILTGCRGFVLAASSVAWLTLFAGARPACADQVSGNVTLDGRPTSSATLVIRAEGGNTPAIEVPTTDRGYYRVFLQPGRYQVTLKNGPSQVLVLISERAPVTQHLAFGRR